MDGKHRTPSLGRLSALIVALTTAGWVGAAATGVPAAEFSPAVPQDVVTSKVATVAVGADERPAADDVRPSPGLIRELLGWIGRNTDYDASPGRSELPTVRVITRGEAVEIEGARIVAGDHLRGAYDAEQRRILLVGPWTADDPRRVSTLLHELVHDVQFASRDWRCMAEAEWEAYKVQHAWLAEQGIQSGFDWLHVFSMSRCRPDVHPE